MKGRNIILAVAAGLLLGAAGGAAWWRFRPRPESRPEALPFGGAATRRGETTGIGGLVLDRLPTTAEWTALTAACRGREAAVSGLFRLPGGAENTAFSGHLTPEPEGAWRADLTAEIDGEKAKITACWLPANGIVTASFPVQINDEKAVAFFGGTPLQNVSGRLHVEMTVEMTEEKPALKALIAMPLARVAAKWGDAAVEIGGAAFRNERWEIMGEADWAGGATVREMTLTGASGAWRWKGNWTPFPGASALSVSGGIAADGAREFATGEPAEMRMRVSGGTLWLDGVEAAGKDESATLTGTLRALTGDGMAASAGTFRAERRDGAWETKLRMPELRLTFDGRPFLFTDAEWEMADGRFTLRAKRAVCFGEDSAITIKGAEVGGLGKENGAATALTWSGALRCRSGSDQRLTAESWRAERTPEGWRGTFKEGAWACGAAMWRAPAGEWRCEKGAVAVSFPAGSFAGGRLTGAKLTDAGLTVAEEGGPREFRAASVEGEYRGFGAFSLKEARWSPTEMTAREAQMTVDGRVWTISGSIPGKVFGKAATGEMTDVFEAETGLVPDGTITFRGRAGGAAFADGEFLFRGAAMRDDLLASLSLEIELPAARIETPVPAAAFGLPKGTFSGRCAASGDFALTRSPRFRGTWRLTGELTAGDEKMTGVEAELTPGAGTLRFARLTAPGFAATDGGGTLAFNAESGACEWTAGSFMCGGGRWTRLSKAAGGTRFSVTGIAAAALHPTLAGAISTPLSGTVTLAGYDLLSAELRAETGGELKLEALEPFRYLPEKGVNPEVFECAAALGRHFLFDRLTLSLRRPGKDGRRLLRLSAAGRPADAVPFVPTETGFRRTQSGETGFFGACELGGDYLLPVVEAPGKP